jgi:hypothetical protein
MVHWDTTTTGVPQELLQQVKEEMLKGSPRAAAVVGCAIVEEHLTHVLKSRMVKDAKVADEMFAPGRTFGDFGAKVDLGYLLGLYSKPAYKELTTIKRIRNAFAHQLKLNSFDRDDIRDLCQNLTLSQSKIVNLTVFAPTPGDDEHRTMLTLGDWNKEAENDIPLCGFAFETCPPSARERFTTACVFYISAFFILTNQNHPIKVPLL